MRRFMLRTRHVLALAALLFLWNAWAYDLWAPDEPYFGEGAREMVVDGQWAVPHVNGAVTTDKPPLFFWLIAIASLPFHRVTSLTARLPSALAMIAAAALTMRLARRFAGERAGPVAGLVFVTTYLVWDKGRSAQIDALLCVLVLAAVSAFEAYRAGDLGGRRAGLLFWASAALATLAKGPVGFLLPLGIALVTLALDRNLRSWRAFAPASGPVLFLGLVGAWMALATIGGHGTYSVWGAFEKHVLERAVHGMHHKQPFWYYAKVLPVQLVPWTMMLPAAILAAWRRRDPGDRFLLAWAAFVVVFFSVPVEKRDLYVLPAYPAFAILVARTLEAPLLRRLATAPHAVWAAAMILVGLAAPVIVPREGYLTTIRAVIPSIAVVLTGATALWACWKGRLEGAIKATALGTATAYVLTATLVFPALNGIKSARTFAGHLAAATAESRAAGHDVVAYDVGNLPEALAFYSGGVYTRVLAEPGALAAHLGQPARVFAVVNEEALEGLPAMPVVLERTELAGHHVALVANR